MSLIADPMTTVSFLRRSPPHAQPATRNATPSGRGQGKASLALALAAPGVRHTLDSPGTPLDAGTRAFMEPRFGQSFADVRVHADDEAARSARSVSAWAYTVGRDVVFGPGRYEPGTPAGRRLLAHELAHVAQQRGAAPVPAARLEVGALDAPEEHEAERAADAAMAGRDAAAALTPRSTVRLRRVPGVDARDSFDAMVRWDLDPEAADRRAPAADAVTRFLRIAEGASLMNQLWTLFCTADGCKTSITLHFVDQLPPGHNEATGVFDPGTRGASAYRVWVRYVKPSIPGTKRKSEWPSSDDPQVVSRVQEPASVMAENIFHEFLHVWFVNARNGQIAPTGHGPKGVEPEFLKRLQTANAQLLDLESVIATERAEAERQAEEKRSKPDAAKPPSPPPPPAGPPPVGGSFGVQIGGGGFAKRPGAFHTILGADAIFNVLGGLRLGLRGIYMTPDHMLLGPGIGYRALQGDGSEPVQRPFFFDLEAGVLFELSPAGASRVTNAFSGFGGVGLGQEFGREGARFWWRVGGMLVITDKPQVDSATSRQSAPVTVGGSGHGGVGVSF